METVKGFKDVTDEEALKRENIKQLRAQKFRIYGFSPAETPIIEFEDFVKASQDETISDVFRLKDRGDRALALRYEFTFQLKRLVQNRKLPYRRYQIGEVFRDEPISMNRFRQFTQCDVDVIGSSARDEAEILKLFAEILKEFKIEAIIYINNRKLLNEILEEQGIRQLDKLAVIKEIDKLDKLPESEIKKNLKKYNAQNIFALLKKPRAYFKKYSSFKEIQELENYCKDYGVKIQFSPSLARGLAYYNSSIFEIKSKAIQASIAGGGSYLINGIQCTGISFGLDRLATLAKVSIEKPKVIIISISQDKTAIKLAQSLRAQGISCFILEKISKSLDYANSQRIPFTIFVGAEELKKKKFKLRDMKSGREALLAESILIKRLKD